MTFPLAPVIITAGIIPVNCRVAARRNYSGRNRIASHHTVLMHKPNCNVLTQPYPPGLVVPPVLILVINCPGLRNLLLAFTQPADLPHSAPPAERVNTRPHTSTAPLATLGVPGVHGDRLAGLQGAIDQIGSMQFMTIVRSCPTQVLCKLISLWRPEMSQP